MYSTRDRGQVQRHYSPATYPHRLNFYDRPPTHDITLEQFESKALGRLRILSEIESSSYRNRTPEETKKYVLELCNKYLPLHSNSAKLEDLKQEREDDVVSHFVLVLVFCKSPELRTRFVKAEMMLFRVRWESDDSVERAEFLKSRPFPWTEITAEEKEALKPQLAACTPNDRFSQERFYKVKWSRVPDLIDKRRVHMHRGYAYVPSSAQSSIVFQEYYDHLVKALEMTSKALPRMDEDDRLVPILEHLSQGFVAGIPSEYSAPEDANGEELRADMIDDLARKHFPLCMRTLHDSLRRDRHLKHFGRLQYGLFLKALGLSVEEALTFWRKSFAGRVQEDKFNKEYRYNIRHSYGLEGKRSNYPAKSCQRILLHDTPGPQDSHGCPFMHYSEDNLQTLLLSTNTGSSTSCVTTADIPEIMKSVQGRHYHVACTRVFEITHRDVGVKKGEGLGGGESVTHPNAYASKSRELEKKKLEGQSTDVEMKIE